MSKMTHEQRRARRARIAAAVGDGTPLPKVCAAFGVSANTARIACDEHGVPVPARPKGGTPSHSTYSILARLINTADTYAQIAADHGISRQRVGQIADRAREHGIDLHQGRKPTNGEPR